MKKTLLAITLAASMISGCSMIGGSDAVSYADLKVEGASLYSQSIAFEVDADGKPIPNTGYVASDVLELEAIRLVINSTFLATKPAYERYIEEVMATPVLGNYFAAVEAAESEEDKRAIYDALLPADQKAIDDFTNSSIGDEIMSGLKDAAVSALKSSAQLLQADTTSMLANVDYSKLMSEKDRVSLSMDQVSYMDSTIVSAYENYQIVSAFSSAE